MTNSAPFCSKPEDRFKVWPTNRDRPAFNAVMGAQPPVDYDAIGYGGERLVDAHRYFSEQAREWISRCGGEEAHTRAAAVETVVRELLQIVVIDLGADENAQEIFETLNARGAQLTAADLIKNFIFQRLLESVTDVERWYHNYWRDFESGFWETEVSVGRVRYPRSSLFLNHWLVARTGEEIVAREVFERFKRFAQDAGVSMTELIARVHRAAGVYRGFIDTASTQSGAIDRLGLFGYRTGVLESEVIKPLVLCLLDADELAVPQAQLFKALDAIESWMVRRMLVRATTKNYNQVIAELVSQLRSPDRAIAGDLVERYLAGQSSESRYWPDDASIRGELATLLAYRQLRRGRLRMVLEAIEDHMRGWMDGKPGLGGERVARGAYAIEHVMPRSWSAHWPSSARSDGEAERDRRVHTLGNLTLLTGKLNSKVSNGPWLGDGGKRDGLEAHDVLVLNRELLKAAPNDWTDDAIDMRTQELAEAIIQIWRVPQNHKSSFTRDRPKPRRQIQLSDLINGGALQPGIALFPRHKRYASHVATLLPDGQVDVDGAIFPSPSGAAAAITGQETNGWWFFLIDQLSKRSLKTVRSDYLNSMSVDGQDGDEEDDGNEES